MWQNEKLEEPRKKTIELDEELTDTIQKSMFGGLRADGKKSLSNTKKIMMGGVVGVFAGLYFGKSPLLLGVVGYGIKLLISFSLRFFVKIGKSAKKMPGGVEIYGDCAKLLIESHNPFSA